MQDPNEIIARIKTSPAGTSIIYHTGFIGNEINKKETRLELSVFADLVYKAYLNGYCELKQRKIKENRFEYIATTLPREGMFERSRRNWLAYQSARMEGPVRQVISTKSFKP